MWRAVHTTDHFCGVHKVLAQMRDVLKEYRFVIKCNVVEQYEVLVNLSHIADVRNDGDVEKLRKKTYGEKLAHSCHTCAVDL